MDKLTSISATRQLMTTTQTHSGSIISTYEVERVAVYPDRLSGGCSTTRLVNKVVLTPQTAYASNGQGGSDLPAATAEEQRTGMMFGSPLSHSTGANSPLRSMGRRQSARISATSFGLNTTTERRVRTSTRLEGYCAGSEANHPGHFRRIHRISNPLTA